MIYLIDCKEFSVVNLNENYLKNFISSEEIEKFQSKVNQINSEINYCSENENDFKGWVNLPSKFSKDDVKKINETAKFIRNSSDIFIVIGIGGSYLGAKASIDFLHSENYNYLRKNTPKIFFVGNNISSGYTEEILEICKDKNVCVNVISKSGGTMETAIAFRIFKKFMEEKYGKKEAGKRIFCTTDKSKGTLLKLAKKEGYKCFEIPDNVGGRYSVLTAVGLLPAAVSGGNIEDILKGAIRAEKDFLQADLKKNSCYRYAVIRNILYNKGKSVEIIAGYEPRLDMFFEWWKQLFAESEGKNEKGIFPSSAVFSGDLHSLGQFIQQGSRILFETVIKSDCKLGKLTIPESKENLDELNYLQGKSLNYINKKAFEATINAHTDGGVPNILIDIKDFSEETLGYLIYFFEKACAMSGYLMGVNPFNQPGVENYKKKMFTLLEKPGYN